MSATPWSQQIQKGNVPWSCRLLDLLLVQSRAQTCRARPGMNAASLTLGPGGVWGMALAHPPQALPKVKGYPVLGGAGHSHRPSLGWGRAGG